MKFKRFFSLLVISSLLVSFSGCESAHSGVMGLETEAASEAEISEAVPSGGGADAGISETQTKLSDISQNIETQSKGNTESVVSKVAENIINIAGNDYDINSEELHLYGFKKPFDNSEIGKLNQFNNISFLYIDFLDENFKADDFSALKNLDKITFLTIHGSPKNLGFIEGMKALKTLSFEHAWDLSFETLSENSSIRELKISDSGILDDKTPFIGIEKLLNLESIFIEGSGPENIKGLSKAQNIRKLRFVNSIFDLSEIGELSNLESLTLWGTGTANINEIKKCKNLSELILWDVDLNDTEILSDLTNLEFLRLWTESGTVENLDFLLGLTNLVELQITLQDNNNTQVLSQLKNLKKLEISNCAYSQEKKDELKSALPECEIIYENESQPSAEDKSEAPAGGAAEEDTKAPLIIDGKKYYSDENFIFSYGGGFNLKTVSYKAIRAYLRGDNEELRRYMLYPEIAYASEENIYYSIGYISLAGVRSESETAACLSYAVAFEDTDSDLFINVYLVKQDIEWKVESIVLERSSTQSQQSAQTPAEPSGTADSSTEEITDASIIIDGQKYYDSDSFILSGQGMNLKILSYTAARAFLRGDEDELRDLYYNPDSEYARYPERNRFDSLEYMALIGVSFHSETEMSFSYALITEYTDSDIYTDVELTKIDDEWRVEFIGMSG
ncbi:MAG: hypothetical protein LBS21_10575 [Clostridiales bacterium]|nr:hypothetical protein [Clostridiales bacterium]